MFGRLPVPFSDEFAICGPWFVRNDLPLGGSDLPDRMGCKAIVAALFRIFRVCLHGKPFRVFIAL